MTAPMLEASGYSSMNKQLKIGDDDAYKTKRAAVCRAPGCCKNRISG
jgi:hypothetical protein